MTQLKQVGGASIT